MPSGDAEGLEDGLHGRARYSRPGMAGRKRLDLDERRSQLLALAKAAFSSRSYDEVSVDELAQAAGVSKGLLYHYFPSKRDLYVATVRQIADELAKLLTPDPALAPIEQLSRTLDAYLRFAEDNAESFLSFMQSGVGRDQEVYALVERTRRDLADLMLKHGQPYFPTPALRILVRGWVGMVEAASLAWLEHRTVSREELTRYLVKTLLSTVQLAGAKKDG
jgi:AcrR family transcriptional regulator